MPNAVIAHDPAGRFDLDKLKAEAQGWPGLDGMDLVPDVTSGQSYTWDEPLYFANGAHIVIGGTGTTTVAFQVR